MTDPLGPHDDDCNPYPNLPPSASGPRVGPERRGAGGDRDVRMAA